VSNWDRSIDQRSIVAIRFAKGDYYCSSDRKSHHEAQRKNPAGLLILRGLVAFQAEGELSVDQFF